MQNFRNQQGQSMAPAIEYLSQMQRIYFDSWRRCGDAGVRWTQNAMETCQRIGQDMLSAPLNHCQALSEKLGDYQQDVLHVVSETQLALARTVSDSTRATADTARDMAEQQASQFERSGRDQADTLREQAGAVRDRAGELREQGGAMAEQAGHAAAHAGEQAQHAQPAGHGQHGADKRDGGADKRDAGPEKREGARGGKGGQDNASTVHQRAGA
ncbi:hypothetical protein [Pseudoduganella sp.]|uniref:hypothetical protein n=1 Tax=Pseudoduganella sp. TaxID=1880898 RepID=UPI0035B13380